MAKKILNEAQVRRFAKLANLSPINEMHSMYEEEEEAGIEAPMDDVAVDAELEGDPALDTEMEDEVGGDDLGAREEMVSKVVLAVADALDVEVAIEGGDESAELEDAELEGDVEDELGAPVEDDALPDEEAAIMEALRGINYVPGKKEIVNEVAKRVARRLLMAKKADRKLKEALGNKRPARRSTRRKK